jgi:hypothetical protein
MRAPYIVAGLAILSFVLLYSGQGLASAANSTANAASNITLAINSTRQYLETVNESAYLIFYPSLDYAYNALGAATNASKTNITKAYAMLRIATNSAAAEQKCIDAYAADSLYALAAIAVVLIAALYYLMRKPGRR